MRKHGKALIGPSGAPLPLSTFVAADDFIFLSGQLAMVDGRAVGDTIEAQAQFIFDETDRLLRRENLTLADIVRVNVWLGAAEDFAGFNSVYSTRLSEPYPARSTVLAGLLLPGAKVEVDFTAHRPSRRAAEVEVDKGSNVLA